VKLSRDDMIKLALTSFISAPPIAFMSFEFMFPTISTPSFGKSLLAVFLISILTGIPSGYLTRRTDLAMTSVFLYTAAGYILAVVFYSVPYTIYDLQQVLPDIYYAMFFRFTMILLFLFVLGGFLGTLFGQMVRDWIKTEETGMTFENARKG
jgi:glucan phosphoethanolaminetransferase (alkaline phosphatase superfamily)